MSKNYLFYAWGLSLYSGKVRSYLKFKKVPFKEIGINIYTLYRTIRKNTGVVVMPVVKSPNNVWIQDSRLIIDHIEKEFPDKSVFPTTPRRRFVSCMLETWGDEFWLPSAMQTRWTHEENRTFFLKEAGDYLLPYAPRFLKNMLASRIAGTLKAYLSQVGIIGEQEAAVVAWTDDMLEKLDKHFAEYPYLLGSEPTIGDFGLIGPLYAHLGRDPWSKRNLTDPKVHLTKWINRMKEGCPVVGDFKSPYPTTATEDAIPPTLIPIVVSMLEEMTPWLQATIDQANLLAPSFTHKRLPRKMGDVQYPLQKKPFTRKSTSFVLWKSQLLLEEYKKLNAEDQKSLLEFLSSLDPVNGVRLLSLNIPPLVKDGLQVRLLNR